MVKPLRALALFVTAGMAVSTSNAHPTASVLRLTQTPAGLRTVPGPVDRVWWEPIDRNYSYGPALAERDLRLAGAQTATITATYDAGFAASPEAQVAFQAAVDIWSTIISSPVPIRVTASFRDLGNPRLLGSAGPTVVCSSAAGQSNTFYSNALADKLAGADVCGPGQAEMRANFNSAFTNWEFGVTGTPVPGKISFLTVVLHELCHGLGFYGSMSVSGLSWFLGSWGETPGVPDIYDRFAFTGGGQALLSLLSPSVSLALVLVSNDVFFTGPNARGGNNGNPAKLESSLNPFMAGSSYSHVDDALYSGTPNGLMTWQIGSAEVYADPGPIVRGILADEGWSAGGGSVGVPGMPTGLTTSASALSVAGGPCFTAPSPPLGLFSNSAGTLAWTASAGSPATYLVEAGSSPGLSNLANLDLGSNAPGLTVVAPTGTYFVRVRGRNACGTSAPSNEIIVIAP